MKHQSVESSAGGGAAGRGPWPVPAQAELCCCFRSRNLSISSKTKSKTKSQIPHFRLNEWTFLWFPVPQNNWIFIICTEINAASGLRLSCSTKNKSYLSSPDFHFPALAAAVILIKHQSISLTHHPGGQRSNLQDQTSPLENCVTTKYSRRK